jgi:hypothetical protein
MEDVERRKHLEAICRQVVAADDLKPLFDPEGRVLATYCNIATARICRWMGYQAFGTGEKSKFNLLANAMRDHVVRSGHWGMCTGELAAEWASSGGLAIACFKSQPHGHVAVVYPGALVYSKKWSCEVPSVANVGQRNGIFGANWAFEHLPEFYKLNYHPEL